MQDPLSPFMGDYLLHCKDWSLNRN